MKRKLFILSIILLLIFAIIFPFSHVNAQNSRWDYSKVTKDTSEDDIDVPIPKGFVASTDTSERYVNGKWDTYYGTWYDVTDRILGNNSNFTNSGSYYTMKTSSTSTIQISIPQYYTQNINGDSSVLSIEWYGWTSNPYSTIYMNILTGSDTEYFDNCSATKNGSAISDSSWITKTTYLKESTTYILDIYNFIYNSSHTSNFFIKSIKILDIDGTTTNSITLKTQHGGFVIYETDNKANIENNIKNAKQTYNQYVWVPVSEETTNKLIKGDETNILQLYTVNNRRYTSYNWNYPIGTEPNINSNSRLEPYIPSDYDSSTWNNCFTTKGRLSIYFNYLTRNELNRNFNEEYRSTIESIQRYGRFYVSRYELSNATTDIPTTKQNQNPTNSINWYNSYKKAQFLTSNINSVESQLMLVCQWNYILNWLIASEEKTYLDIIQPTGWGNYLNNTFTDINGLTKDIYSSSKVNSGISEYFNANNIYDLAGNLSEWTQEAYSCSSSNRCFYGGNYNMVGAWQPVGSSASGVSPTTISSYYGLRATLRI